MSDISAKLQLPFIQASQAQKHVTHNEALRKLDGLVQLAVISKDQATPPASPATGDSYVVASAATGAWAGQGGNLAIWDGLSWTFFTPNEGWTAWVSDLDALWSFDGTGWVESAPPEDFQNVPMIGINTTADAANRLSVSAPATLLNNEGAGHQLKINKAADTDTASLLFQSAWTGHAEMGLAGGTDFTVKTSDGTAWFTALQCSSVDGRVRFPAGISGQIQILDTGRSVFLGEGAGASDDLSGNDNVFVGYQAGNASTNGTRNIAIGSNALNSNVSGNWNIAVGYQAAQDTTANNNIAIGDQALQYNVGGIQNTAFGKQALKFTTTGANNTSFNNCAGFGFDTRVSGSNQVQLGNSSTTTYAYGAVQDRSDARDKADIRDTVLGLDFLNALRPVDFRWDMRDDYFERVEEIDPETGEVTERLVALPKDGSRKRGRFHHGLIAQEVAAVLKETGLDFGGYQDHNYDGNGSDVLSLGYTELIAPLIKAVQELSARLVKLEQAV